MKIVRALLVGLSLMLFAASCKKDKPDVEPPPAFSASKLHGQRGTEITLTGHEFSASTQIKIGDVAVTEFTRNGNSLTFKIPATATGGTLSVTDGSFTWNSPEPFEVTNLWLKVAELDMAQRIYASGFVVGDKFYFGLGRSFNGAREEPLKDFYEVDLKTWAISNMPDYPFEQISGAASVAFNGKGYIFSGEPISSSTESKKVYAFDPASTTKWQALADFPSNGFQGGVAFVLNNKIIAGLGYMRNPVINNDRCSNFMYTFDPSTGTGGSWNTTALFLTGDNEKLGLWAPLGVSDGQTAYVGTGYQAKADNDIQSMWKYSVAGGWSAIADFPYKGESLLGAVINGKLIAGTGMDNSNFVMSNKYYQYTPASNTWTALSDGPIRQQGLSFVYNNHFYVLSGADASGSYSKEVWKYVPIRD